MGCSIVVRRGPTRQDFLVPQGQDKFGANSSTMSLKTKYNLHVIISMFEVSYRATSMFVFFL
jgi:hypothetical protein